MLQQLIVYNFHPSEKITLFNQEKAPFILNTCQRTIIVSLEIIQTPLTKPYCGSEAYAFLLEIICGLQSKLLGENEIVGQFKTAYKDYLTQNNRCNNLLMIIEKLFQDAKDIRTNYLIGLCQKTYSSIARKHIINKFQAKEVLILGSGSLAEDLINQFKKYNDIYICARNDEKLRQLEKQHSVKTISWNNFSDILRFPFIANSIGASQVLFNQDFFMSWKNRHQQKLFVDLGSPSCIQTSLSYNEGVMMLDDIFKEGAIHESRKKEQISQAKLALSNIVEKRTHLFSQKLINKSLHKVNLHEQLRYL
jgi:glutamyl-tRNA reductase